VRKRYATLVALLLALAVSLLPWQAAAADMGPKPTMNFTFTQGGPGPQLSILSGTLYECQQADCSDAQPLKKNMGPQRFTCDDSGCNSMSYGYAPYHRIEIAFSDGKTRQSNIFRTAGFSSVYKVTVRQDDLLVETDVLASAPASMWIGIVLGVCCCLAFLLVVAVIVIVVVRRNSKK